MSAVPSNPLPEELEAELIDQIVAFDAAIHDRHGFKRFHGRLNKERHQPEFHAVFFRELILLAPAQLNSGFCSVCN